MATANPYERDILLDQLGRRTYGSSSFAPPNGNTGFSGGTSRPVEVAGAAGLEPGNTAAAPAAGGDKPSIFQSGNNSLSGYLQEAAAAYRPELIKHQGDAARKTAAEAYIRSLEPELTKRGWKGGDIRNEKLQVDGRWIDLYQDIEGAANAQYHDTTNDAPAGGGGAGGMVPGGASSLSSIQGLMPTDTDFFKRLQAQLQEQLGGPQAFEREALLRQLGA